MWTPATTAWGSKLPTSFVLILLSALGALRALLLWPARDRLPVALGQALSCVLFGGAGLFLEWDSVGVEVVSALMALAFVYLPDLLWRSANAAFNAGRYRRAAVLARARAVLQWDRETLSEARILELWSRIDAGKGGDAEAEALLEETAGTTALRGVQVAGLARLGRWHEATRLFEEEIGWKEIQGAPGAVHLVRAYAEQGRIPEALRALAALEPWLSVPEARAQIRRKLDFLPAKLGREGGSGPAWALTPAEEALLARWLGPDPPAPPGPPPVDFRRGRLATRIVLGICFATFAAGLLEGDTPFEPKISTLVTFGGDVPALVRLGETWRLVAAIFLHAGILHLALNAYALWILGEMIEGFFGRRGFWAIFLLTGLAGTAASAMADRAPLAVGASGGVFGLLGASVGFLLVRRGVFPASQRRGLIRHMLLMTGLNLLLGLSIPQVDNTAHLGGLATGFVLGLVLHPVSLSSCPPWQRGLQTALAALAGALVLTAALRAARNASGEGYPYRPGPMSQVRMEGFLMSRPAWWTGWEDRMGIALEYRGAFRPGAPEVRLLEGADRAWIGGRMFRVIPGRQGCDYLLERGREIHLWSLRAEGGWEDGGGDALARRMLETLEFPDDPPSASRILPGAPCPA